MQGAIQVLGFYKTESVSTMYPAAKKNRHRSDGGIPPVEFSVGCTTVWNSGPHESIHLPNTF